MRDWPADDKWLSAFGFTREEYNLRVDAMNQRIDDAIKELDAASDRIAVTQLLRAVLGARTYEISEPSSLSEGRR